MGLLKEGGNGLVPRKEKRWGFSFYEEEIPEGARRRGKVYSIDYYIPTGFFEKRGKYEYPEHEIISEEELYLSLKDAITVSIDFFESPEGRNNAQVNIYRHVPITAGPNKGKWVPEGERVYISRDLKKLRARYGR